MTVEIGRTSFKTVDKLPLKKSARFSSRSSHPVAFKKMCIMLHAVGLLCKAINRFGLMVTMTFLNRHFIMNAIATETACS